MNFNEFFLLDGAMGTMLQAAGLPAGALPEVWNITNPQAVTTIQKQYVDAGSNLIFANTFGANPLKLKNSGYSVEEVVTAGIAVARAATEGTDCKVALDIGPLGHLLEPLGLLSFDDAYDAFRQMCVAGKKAGADLIVIETMSDLREVKAAMLAAKEHTDLPIWVTMTFEKSGRSFVGVTVPAMALTLTALGAQAIGFNCSLGPKELLPMVEELAKWTHLPIILKPNAGLPDTATGLYNITPEEFAGEVMQAVSCGVKIFGGCCGTGPAYIAALKNALKNQTPVPRNAPLYHGVSSGTLAKSTHQALMVGECINPTGKKDLQEALREEDYDFVVEMAMEQQDAGADILDINLGLRDIDQVEAMTETVKEIQLVVNLPLQLDSTDPEVLEAGLRVYNGKPIVNSVNGEEKSLHTILPLCRHYGAAVIGLCMDENGIPETAEGRLAIARKIMETALSYGISKEDIYIDCLTLAVSAQPQQAEETLRALRMVKEELGLKTTLGVSNISFGMPQRDVLTTFFLTRALEAGLDLPIVNPNRAPVMNAMAAHRALGEGDVMAWIRRFSGEITSENGIIDAVLKGLSEDVRKKTKAALETLPPLSVVSDLLIPALDAVGAAYEAEKIFLPQLMTAAQAASAGFEEVKKVMARQGIAQTPKGTIVMATVRGDIHDIGKNIVVTVLENYGYRVVDLGKDVAPETIVAAALQEKAFLVGLSALMTTTLPAMEETISALKAAGYTGKIIVGGAVVTEDYAKRIGADFYGADAAQAVRAAKEALS